MASQSPTGARELCRVSELSADLSAEAL
jgi:hypothetical protein